MKKYLITGFALLLITGCSDYPTDEQYIDSRKWCDQFGGVKSSSFTELKGLRVRCMDGALVIKHFGN